MNRFIHLLVAVVLLCGCDEGEEELVCSLEIVESLTISTNFLEDTVKGTTENYSVLSVQYKGDQLISYSEEITTSCTGDVEWTLCSVGVVNKQSELRYTEDRVVILSNVDGLPSDTTWLELEDEKVRQVISVDKYGYLVVNLFFYADNKIVKVEDWYGNTSSNNVVNLLSYETYSYAGDNLSQAKYYYVRSGNNVLNYINEYTYDQFENPYQKSPFTLAKEIDLSRYVSVNNVLSMSVKTIQENVTVHETIYTYAYEYNAEGDPIAKSIKSSDKSFESSSEMSYGCF